MALIKSHAITSDNIKCRWEEPYVSSAINRTMSSLPRGVYRGFVVQEMATPGAGVTISIGTYDDSFLLHENTNTGHKTAVRYDADFDITFSFTNATDYYIWVDVTYQVSSSTTGYIKIGELSDFTAAIAADAIPIAKFNSTTTIYNADITQSPTSSPITFLTPVPDTSEKNYWGLLDQTRFDRLPTQNQKDAMDSATAPTSGNPFLTVADTPTNNPFTYIVSDGTRSTGGDYDAPTAIQSAMDALEAAGVPGDIYVRRGEYTLTANKSYTVPMKIICEGSPGKAIGVRCILSASSYKVTFNEPVQIFNLEISGVSGANVLEIYDEAWLSFVHVSLGRTYFNGAAVKGRANTCVFDGQVQLNAIPLGFEFNQCAFTGEASQYCMLVSNQCDYVRIINCTMDATASGTQDGGGILFTLGNADTSNWVIDGLDVQSRGALVSLDLRTSGSDQKQMTIKNVVSTIHSQTGSGGSFNIFVSTADSSYLKIDGVRIDVNHSNGIGTGLLAVRFLGSGSQGVADISNVIINGNGNVIDNATTGTVYFYSVGSSNLSTINVKNLAIRDVRGNQTGLTTGYIVVTDGSGNINIDGLRIYDLDTTAITAAAYLVGVKTLTDSKGAVSIQNSYIDGFGLDVSFTGNYYGILNDVNSATPGSLFIKDSTITHWNKCDVWVQSSAYLCIDGLSHKGTANMIAGTPGARISLNLANYFRITNCHYDDLASGVATPYWCYVANTASDVGTFANNLVKMPGAGDEAIYCVDSTGPLVFTGNGGVGRINVLNTDNHIGIGDGDNNVNTLAVNLR
jgi:hypothetical protein